MWNTFRATISSSSLDSFSTACTSCVSSQLRTFTRYTLTTCINYLFHSRITSPLLLIAVLASFSVCYWVFTKSLERRAVLFGHELTLTQQYSIVGLFSMPIFYIVGAGAALFWVLGASCFLIMTHAVFFDVDSLLEPEEESFELTMEQVV
jgi:anoctamin-1